jgi:hypothetical protein
MPRTNREGKKIFESATKKRKANSGSKLADLQTKPDHYLECREMRHSFTRIGYFHWSDKGKRAICRVAVCQRCGVIRDTFFYASGKRMDSKYHYPDHYLLIGDGRISNADVVLESMRRVGISADRDSMLTDTPSRRLRAVGT